MSQPLILVGDRTVLIAGQAEELKSSALERAALIGAVKDEASNNLATEALRGISTVIKSVEAARKAVKEPVIELGRQIDNAAKEFCADLKAEEMRLQREMADFQQAQLEKIRAIERARAEEAARIERERMEAERKMREEQERVAAEARAKAEEEIRKARSAKAKAEAEARAKAEQERLATEAADALKRQHELRAQELQMIQPAPEQVRASGQTVRVEWSWEVTDIWQLAKCHPNLVRIEPRADAIREVLPLLAKSSPDGAPRVAGLRIWEETKVSVRTGREKPAINI